MKVLSLLQPWASALFVPVPNRYPLCAAKSWETRSWKPTTDNLRIIQRNGLLIHASKAMKRPQQKLLNDWPFKDYLESIELPLGAIIGWVRIGEILTTEAWKARFSVYEDGAAERYAEEYRFGDYNNGRFAWEIKEFKLFQKNTPVNGALSLWNFNPDKLLDNGGIQIPGRPVHG